MCLAPRCSIPSLATLTCSLSKYYCHWHCSSLKISKAEVYVKFWQVMMVYLKLFKGPRSPLGLRLCQCLDLGKQKPEEKSIAFPRLTLDGYAPFFGVMRNPGEWNSSLNLPSFAFENILKPTHNRSATEGFGTRVSAAKSDLSWGLLVNQMLDDSLFKVPKSQDFGTNLFGSRSPFCPPKEILWWVLDQAGPWRIARHDTKASLVTGEPGFGNPFWLVADVFLFVLYLFGRWHQCFASLGANTLAMFWAGNDDMVPSECTALHEVSSTAYSNTSASTWCSVHAAYVNETLWKILNVELLYSITIALATSTRCIYIIYTIFACSLLPRAIIDIFRLNQALVCTCRAKQTNSAIMRFSISLSLLFMVKILHQKGSYLYRIITIPVMQDFFHRHQACSSFCSRFWFARSHGDALTFLQGALKHMRELCVCGDVSARVVWCILGIGWDNDSMVHEKLLVKLPLHELFGRSHLQRPAPLHDSMFLAKIRPWKPFSLQTTFINMYQGSLRASTASIQNSDLSWTTDKCIALGVFQTNHLLTASPKHTKTKVEVAGAHHLV